MGKKPLYYSHIFDKNASKSNYLQINEDKILNMIKEYGFQETINKIVKMLEKYDFPYKKEYMTETSINDSFNKLQKYNYKLVETPYQVYSITFINRFLYNNKSLLLEKSSSDYLDYNLLSDYFQENCRMKCKRYDANESPFDFWIEHKSKIVAAAIKDYGKINIYTLRESIYKLSGECTSFRPTIMVSLIKFFNAKRILDFSAGWGDRLIGAMAAPGVEFYCGVDPNSCLHPNYQKMIDFFIKNNKDKKKFKMIHSPFETAKIPNKKYDLVCTSPPYFTLEIYSDENTQSTSNVSNVSNVSSFSDSSSITSLSSDSNNNSVDKWLNDFLFFSLRKAWKHLIKGGHMVIIINDMKEIKFVEKMLDYVKDRIIDSKYLGTIGYAEKMNDQTNKYKSPQPMWIWQKI